MTTVRELVPGDLVILPAASPALPDRAVYIAQTAHPLYRGLQLVIWRMPDGGLSLDALSPAQYVGEAQTGPLGVPGDGEREQRLRQALHGGAR